MIKNDSDFKDKFGFMLSLKCDKCENETYSWAIVDNEIICFNCNQKIIWKKVEEMLAVPESVLNKMSENITTRRKYAIINGIEMREKRLEYEKNKLKQG